MSQYRNRYNLLPLELEETLERELEGGERILWTAQPSSGRAMRRYLPHLLFAIPWTAFAVFWVVSAFKVTSEGEDSIGAVKYIFPAFGIPFVGVGLYLMSRPFLARSKAKQSAYAVTDRRAIIVAAGSRGKRTVTSFLPEELANLERFDRPDGSGDLIFSRVAAVNPRGRRLQALPVGFIGIDNVQDVEKIIRENALKNSSYGDAGASTS